MLKWGAGGVGCYATAFAQVYPRCGKVVGVKEGDEEAVVEASTSASIAIASPPPSTAHQSGVLTTSTVQQRRDEKARTTHWLAIGAKDGKVSLWDIY